MEPTPVFLPGESHRQRNLAGYSPGCRKELDITERLSIAQHREDSTQSDPAHPAPCPPLSCHPDLSANPQTCQAHSHLRVFIFTVYSEWNGIPQKSCMDGFRSEHKHQLGPKSLQL